MSAAIPLACYSRIELRADGSREKGTEILRFSFCINETGHASMIVQLF